MATATIDADTWRRTLMDESDRLLEEVESLRLADEDQAPITLREAIQGLQRRLGRKDPPLPPATLHSAHDLVFAVQQRIMAANPNHPRPRVHAGRPGGQPVITHVRDQKLWKLLSLPPPPNGTPDADWLQLVDSTVERAWDRWCYAQQQAVRAARAKNQAAVALAVARIAWANYWELDQEAKAIRRRLSALPQRMRVETRAALTV
ncbi:MAG TPA: hypothetical protein VFB69_04445 [Candidatus Dormibacteraeota bacterium]|nr:hypothetical protein [Candidatus Dormibacteraeota bacterium]